MKRIGVRELRQNASEHLRLVQAGESFEITDRGRPIALLVPLGTDAGPLQALTRAGRLSTEAGDLLDLGAPLAPNHPTPPSQTLEEMRASER